MELKGGDGRRESSWREFWEGISLYRETHLGGQKTKIGTTPGFAAQRATFFAQLWNFLVNCSCLFCYFLVLCLLPFAAWVCRSFLPTASSHSFVVPHRACF
jgi:hypothetical protein